MFFLLPSQSTHLIFVWCLSLRFVQTRIRFFRFFFFLIPNLCRFFFLCPTSNIKHWTNTWWEKKKNKQTQTHYYNNHFRVDFFSPISYLNFIRSSGNILYSFFSLLCIEMCLWVSICCIWNVNVTFFGFGIPEKNHSFRFDSPCHIIIIIITKHYVNSMSLRPRIKLIFSSRKRGKKENKYELV